MHNANRNNQSDQKGEFFFEAYDPATYIVWGVGITECKALEEAKTKLKERTDEDLPSLNHLLVRSISKDRYIFILQHGTP